MIKALEWSTEKRKVNDLLPLEINPRKISAEKQQRLINSLQKFNLAEIPAINKDNTIIAGHQRLKALQLIGRGDEEIDVRVPNRQLNLKELKEYNLISNTHAGDWDFELFDLHFSDIDSGELMVDVNEFKPQEVEMENVVQPEAQEDDYELPNEIKTDIVEGDLFEIGEHRLLCGSSTQTDTWKRIMGEELADLVITDPPYNIDYKGRSNGHKLINDKQDDGNFYKFLYDFYTALNSFTKAGGVWYIWHTEKECVNFYTAFKNAGLEWGKTLIWNKNNLGMGSDYRNKHEPCIYGWSIGAKHNWYSDKSQTTVLNFERPQRNAEHPTMKPVPLIAYQMQNSSKIGDIVCDGFGGSGTTMVASHQLKRKCRMIELDPNYCQVIIERMRKLDPAIVIKRNGEVWNTQKIS